MKHSIENAILWGCVLVIIAFIVLMLLMGGCASNRQEIMEIEYTKGCNIKVRGLSNDVANKMSKEMNFRDCEASGTDMMESGPNKPD